MIWYPHTPEYKALIENREALARESIAWMDEFDRLRKLSREAEGPFWKTLGRDGHDQARGAWYAAMATVEDWIDIRKDLHLRQAANRSAMQAMRKAYNDYEDSLVQA